MPTTPPSSRSSPAFHLPVRGRWGGGEGPPSLRSQPLNQALSHPVNLKQLGFNSSCLSVPALAPSVEARSSEAHRLRPAKPGWDAPEHSSQALASFSLSAFGFLHSCLTASSDPWCQGNFWNSTLFCFTVHGGSDCAAHQRRWAQFKLRWLLILVTFWSQLLWWSPKSRAFMQRRHPNTTTEGPNDHPGQIFVLTGNICIKSNCISVLSCFYQIIPLPDNITLSAKQMRLKWGWMTPEAKGSGLFKEAGIALTAGHRQKKGEMLQPWEIFRKIIVLGHLEASHPFENMTDKLLHGRLKEITCWDNQFKAIEKWVVNRLRCQKRDRLLL